MRIIALREILGSNFAFIHRQHLNVKKGSKLANDIETLYRQNLNFKICEIANFLYQVTEGYIDESIKEYL